MSELKPCPFCGGKASVERMGTNRVSMQYSCDDCGCFIESGETWIDEKCKWNTRHVSASQISNNTKETHLRVIELEEKLQGVVEFIDSMWNFDTKNEEDFDEVGAVYKYKQSIIELLNK